MAFKVADYCDVQAKASALGLNIPTGLAILPRNFDTAAASDELFHESTASTIRILLCQSQVEETRIEKAGQKIPEIKENQFELIFPIIFVSVSLLTNNPALLTISLNIIANYATDFFKGIPGRKKVRLDIVVENPYKKVSKRVKYEGPPEGLKGVEKIVKQVFK